MKLLVERWEKGKDETTGEEIELVKESVEVANEDEATTKASEFKSIEGTTRVTLHKCYHDETPTKPCERKEL